VLQKTLKLVGIANVETPTCFVLIKSNPILFFGFDYGDHLVMIISRCWNVGQYMVTSIGFVEQFMGNTYKILDWGLKRGWVTTGVEHGG
jgi:hypothetical protein